MFKVVRITMAATLAALVSFPTASLAKEASSPGFCFDVSYQGSMSAPIDETKVAIQTFTLTEDCRVVPGPVVELETAAIRPSSSSQSSLLGSAGSDSETTSPASLASTSYRTNAGLRVFDCCGILLTELWMENTWTSSSPTGGITAWGATDGASWHREAGNTGGWSLDSGTHFLGLVGGGLYASYEKVKANQGFNYQGTFDRTGTLFYNRLTLYLRGDRNGTFICTFDYYLKKVPAGPLAWPPPQTVCGRGYYAYR